MNRQILIIIAIVSVLLITLGVGYWFFIMRDTAPEPTPQDDSMFIFGDNGRLIGEAGSDEGGTPTDPNTLNERLLEITNEPIAGFTVFEKASGTSTAPIIRYILRSNGHIYDYNLTTGERVRLSNITLAHSFNAVWAENGSGAFIQQLSNNNETVETTFVDMSEAESTSTNPIYTSLAQNIKHIDIKNGRFAWIRTSRNEAIVETGSLTGINPEVAYRSELTEWNVFWKNENTLLLTTKPSGLYPGYSYELTINNESLTPFLSNITGLTVLPSPLGNEVIYSRSTSNTFHLFSTVDILDPSVITPQTRTLPEKCVFSPRTEAHLYCAVPRTIPGETYPDAWYQGKVSFSDTIEYINLEEQQREEVYNPVSETNRTLDIINPRVTSDERYFVFQDKTSGRLWRLRI